LRVSLTVRWFVTVTLYTRLQQRFVKAFDLQRVSLRISNLLERDSISSQFSHRLVLTLSYLLHPPFSEFLLPSESWALYNTVREIVAAKSLFSIKRLSLFSRSSSLSCTSLQIAKILLLTSLDFQKLYSCESVLLAKVLNSFRNFLPADYSVL